MGPLLVSRIGAAFQFTYLSMPDRCRTPGHWTLAEIDVRCVRHALLCLYERRLNPCVFHLILLLLAFALHGDNAEFQRNYYEIELDKSMCPI